ncbi:MAG: sensor histidine kinase, partial [Gemmatimonadota bacterium]
FLADAGHEIKTPLTVLRGDISLALRRDRSAAEYREVLGRCLEEITEVTTLADDLITLARSDSGQLPTSMDSVEGKRLLEHVADRFRDHAGEQGLEIVVEAAGETGFEGNAGLLERAVEALVENAVKYAGSGSTVRLRAERRDGAIQLAVRDDGPGIPEDERDEVTERFRRGERARQQARGTGLGLSIASAAAESHGGRLELESEEGRGTEVRILIPVPAGDGQGGSA